MRIYPFSIKKTIKQPPDYKNADFYNKKNNTKSPLQHAVEAKKGILKPARIEYFHQSQYQHRENTATGP